MPETGCRPGSGCIGKLGSRGAAYVEFAIVAPLLLLLLLGMSDLAPSLVAKMKSGNATYSVADLTSQFSRMQPSDVEDVFAGGGAVMQPFAGGSLVLRITNVASNGNGRAFVYWSCGQGALPPYAARSTVQTTPAGHPITTVLWLSDPQSGGYPYHSADTSVVMVETMYTYAPPTGFFLKGSQNLTAAAFASPRTSTSVAFPWDGNANTVMKPPNSAAHTSSLTLSNGAVCNYSY